MTIGSLFSGIGGLELGLEWAGHGPTIWQVEQCPKLRNCLATHWPEVERFDDVRTVGAHNLEPVDIICGGFPCQDISGAGKGAGLGGSRSGLWFEMERIIKELRPAWVIIENVASGASRWVDTIRRCLEKQGYASLPVPISAEDCGAWHRRPRIFIIAYREMSQRQWSTVAESSRRYLPSGSIGTTPTAPDFNGQQLREQSGWSSGTQGKSERESQNNNAYADSQRKPQQAGSKPYIGRWAFDGSIWAAEPNVARMVHGLPGRVDRERALGNSVVPQCAQVVGEVINLLTAGKDRL